ncbi:HipA domain protein [Microbacterium sp. HM58-2]|nr:HipA domain protein [Microbacterium sp. HM58-2]
MSTETLQGIHEAIAAHLADTQGEGSILGDFFIAYSSMKSDPDHPSGIAHGIHYATSDTSPHGVLGIAHLGVANLSDDLTPWADE